MDSIVTQPLELPHGSNGLGSIMTSSYDWRRRLRLSVDATVNHKQDFHCISCRSKALSTNDPKICCSWSWSLAPRSQNLSPLILASSFSNHPHRHQSPPPSPPHFWMPIHTRLSSTQPFTWWKISNRLSKNVVHWIIILLQVLQSQYS